MSCFGSTVHGAFVALIVLALADTVHAFTIVDVQASHMDRIIEISANMDLMLSDDVRDAVNGGIGIPVVTEIRVYRKRQDDYFDNKVAELKVAESLQYVAVQNRYTVESENSDIAGRFTSLESALNSLGKPRKYRIALSEDAEPGAMYRAKIRVRLERRKLPAVLRLTALLKNSWRLNSRWFDFEIQ